MRVFRAALALVFAFASFSATAGDVDAPVIVPMKSRVKTEGTKGIPGLHATFEIKAPRDQVLETLWNIDRFQEIFPDIKKLTVKERGEDMVRAEFHVDAVLKKISYTLHRTVDRKKGDIVWREAGGDLEKIRGAWRVRPTRDEGVTRVTYESFVEVGGFVPTGLYRDLAMRKVTEMAARVRAACAPKR